MPTLKRHIGLTSAISLNVMNMIGVGPFITLPLVVAAMGGPQAILGWILGAAMPRAGGSYAFLREIYRTTGERDQVTHELQKLDATRAWVALNALEEKASSSKPPFDLGRYLSFLYIWQLSFTAPLSIASGCIGLAQYAAYLAPALHRPVIAARLSPHWTSVLAASVCTFTVLLLYRGVSAITRVAGILTIGVLATVGAIIIAGFTHMHLTLLRFTPHSLTPNHAFLQGLGFATLIATYDYWGYYNVCFLGAEIREPGRTIPRAVLLSIALVATLYLGMHVAVLGVIPWQQLVHGTSNHAAAAMLMERTWGHPAAITISLLIIWTALASVAALLLGYSRAPYAAALDGNYFHAFSRLHPKHGFPHISLLALGAAAMFFCFFSLAQVIAALVAVRIVLQYVLQQLGVMVLRWRRPKLERPFRMWLYPLPPLVALTGFLFLLISRKGAERELLFAAIVAVTGTIIFQLRERRKHGYSNEIATVPK